MAVRRNAETAARRGGGGGAEEAEAARAAPADEGDDGDEAEVEGEGGAAARPLDVLYERACFVTCARLWAQRTALAAAATSTHSLAALSRALRSICGFGGTGFIAKEVAAWSVGVRSSRGRVRRGRLEVVIREDMEDVTSRGRVEQDRVEAVIREGMDDVMSLVLAELAVVARRSRVGAWRSCVGTRRRE